VLFSSAVICFSVYLAGTSSCQNKHQGCVFEWIGIRSGGIFSAAVYSTLLIASLFFGPIVMFFLDEGVKNLGCFSFYDIILWRNYIVVSEMIWYCKNSGITLLIQPVCYVFVGTSI